VRRARGHGVWHRTPCRFCGVGCGLLVAVRDGRALAVKGDPESTVSRGLACARGYHSIQALYGRDRLTRALVRQQGALVEVPLATAYDTIAERLRDTIARHGRDSVGVYGSGQWSVVDAYVATKLFKAGIGTNNVDTNVRLSDACGRAGLVASFGLDGAAGCFDDIDHADVFVLWGHNMAESDPVLFSRLLERRRTNPAVKIIDIGTRATRTSYAADRHLLHAPHTEIALANAICHELLARRWVNRDFVDRHVAFRRDDGAGTGDTMNGDGASATFAEFARFLDGYTPERAQALAGLPAEDIRWLASLYGDRSRRVLSLWGEEVNRHPHGTWLNNTLYNIHLLVGRIAAPGNGALCLTTQPGGSDAVHAAGAAPDALPAGSVRDAAARTLASRIWGVPAERLPTTPGRTALELFRGLEDGSVRMLWVQAANPMASLPNAQRYLRAARGAGAFTVVTEAYPTTTTAIADVVLPAALWLEREGIFGSAERRTQHFPEIVRAPGESASDAWHMIEVARRLGVGGLFPWTQQQHVQAAWNEYARFHTDSRSRPAPLAELRARPGLLWPYVEGRETKWRYNAAHDPAARGGIDFYGHADGRARIWLRPHEPPAEVPDETYPLWLAVGRVLEHTGSGALTRRIPALHRAAPRACAELNRRDASALGVRNRDRIRLVTRRGALEVEARIGYRTEPPPGQVFLPSFDEAAPAHRLTLDAGCPLSGQPDHGRCAVRVERVDRVERVERVERRP
jgi:nitrate reductase (cytochrome)